MRIAIISTNKSKYSETFVKSHLDYLNGEIHYLFDGYLPRKYSADKGITEQDFLPVKHFNFKHLFKTRRDPKLVLASSIKKYIIHHKIQVVLAEYGPSGVELMEICVDLKIPLVVHFHGYDAYRNDVLSTYGLNYEQLFKVAHTIIAVSKDMYEQLEKMGCPESKLVHIPYGIEDKIFEAAKSNNSTSNTFVSCGRFVPKKAPQITIQAFKQVHDIFPDFKLVMIGDGVLQEECKALSKKLNLEDAVCFSGVRTQKEIHKIYQKSFAFLQHSILTLENDSEGTPLSILEAMATGLPVIATNHAGIKDIITSNYNGVLINEMDEKQMAVEMTKLIKNKKVATQMGQRAARLIKEKYTMSIYIHNLEKILINAVHKNRYNLENETL